MQSTTSVCHAIEFEGSSPESWELAARSAFELAAQSMRDLGRDGRFALDGVQTYRVRLQVLCDADVDTSCVLNGI
jgi:flavin-binding protein dodecin